MKSGEDKLVTVYYYDHNCEYISKYCDEFHTRSVKIPASVLREHNAPI